MNLATTPAAKVFVRDESDLYGRTTANLDAICDRLATTHDSLTEILASNPEYPSKWLFLQWMRKDDLAATQYARARLEQADAFEEEIIALATAPAERTENGVDSGEVAHRRLAIDSLKWAAGKRHPKKYGDRELGSVNVNVGVGVNVMTEADRAKLMEERKLALRAANGRVIEAPHREGSPSVSTGQSQEGIEQGASGSDAVG